MAHRITLIPGDGIGHEVSAATVRILEATGAKFDWETFQAGAEAYEKYKEYIPKELNESIERTRVGLKGPVTTPIGGGFAGPAVHGGKVYVIDRLLAAGAKNPADPFSRKETIAGSSWMTTSESPLLFIASRLYSAMRLPLALPAARCGISRTIFSM